MKLTEINIDNEAQSAIVYGPPKSGKTDLIVRGLAHHFNVLYVDLEKGVTTLMKFPAELKERIEVIRVKDFKESPNAINTSLHLASGKAVSICHEHGVKDCTECKLAARKEPDKEFFTTYCLNDLDPSEWVIVFDSFTQMTSSANAHVARNLDLEKDKLTFDHWRAQGVLLEKFLDYVQNARYNVAVITHEMGIEQSDKTERLMPSGGTKNFARNVAKYFDHIVYVNVRNRKHTAISSTTASANAMAGSRTDIEVDMSNPESVCALFGKAVTKVAAKPVASPATGGLASLKSKLAR